MSDMGKGDFLGRDYFDDEYEDDSYLYDDGDIVEDFDNDILSPVLEGEDSGVSVTLVEERPVVEKPLGVFSNFIIEDDGDEDLVPASLEVEPVSSGSSVPDTKEVGGILSQEEKARYYADRVVSAIVGGKSARKYAMSKLISYANPKIFRDENYIIFSVIYNYRDRIKNINIDSEFLSMYLETNKQVIEKSKGYIDIHAYGEVDGSEVLAYIGGVVKHFNRLRGMEDITEEEFDLDFEKYVIIFKSLEAQKVYADSNMILTDGLKVSGKTLVGFDDSYNYSRRKLAEIEGLVDMNQGTGFTSMNDLLMAKDEEGKKAVKIADFDKLEALNKHYGGVYTGNFYQVLAPPKAGKSKFCARVCHTAIVKFGTNVTVWAQEGGPLAWSAQMRAIHFDYTYNEGCAVTDRKYGIDQKSIIYDNFPSSELKELEMVSKLDLISNDSYGKVDFIDRPFEVETFLDEIDTSVKANNSKLLIIDYLQLIGSSNPRRTERERISIAYTSLLNYCKKNNIAVMTPAQYKQSTVDSLAEVENTSDMDMRTAGAGSSEVLRTPDIIFSFWASTSDLRNHRMTILSVPCRFNKAFPEIPCYIDLGTCQFVSLEGDS